MYIFEENVECEVIIKKSKFLGFAIYLKSNDELKEILKSFRERYSCATHICYAFILGNTGENGGCSDDGEPSGTAGKPMLEILKFQKFTNTIIIVVRFFGGVKLGTGGLIRAYSETLKMLISKGIKKRVIEKRTIRIIFEYQYFDLIKKTIQEFNAKILEEFFLENIKLEIEIEKETEGKFIEKLNNITAGTVIV